MSHALHLAAPIQKNLAGHPYQITMDGMVIGHFRNLTTAKATAAHYPGSKVRTVQA